MTAVPQPRAMLGPSAQLYASKFGWAVFPLHWIERGRCSCKRPDCGNQGKHPLVGHGFLDATRDAAQIQAWWDKWPAANIGIATGRASGLVVLDVDPRNGGEDSLEGLRLQHGPLPPTVQSRTGGGGDHYLFAYPPLPVGDRIQSGKFLAGLDLKADGGYIVAPPSVHASGRAYAWEASSVPGEVPFAPPPAWLLEGRAARPAVQGGAPSGVLEESFLYRVFLAAGWLGDRIDSARVSVRCPWATDHTSEPGARDTSSVLFAPSGDRTLGWFHCSHSHCAGRSIEDVLAAAPAEAVQRAKREEAAARAAMGGPSSGPVSAPAAAPSEDAVEEEPPSKAEEDPHAAMLRAIQEGRAFEPQVLAYAAAFPQGSEDFQALLAAVKAAGKNSIDWRAGVRDARKLRLVKVPSAAPGALEKGTARGTDLANAEGLVRDHGAELLHVQGQGWHIWDGVRWGLDDAEAERRAKAFARSLMVEAERLSLDHDDLEDAKRAQSAKGLSSMLTLAKTEPRVCRRYTDLDRDPMLLNCQNGTIDLRTGKLRPHDRGDAITHVCPVDYDPAARSPFWEGFLDFVAYGNEDLIKFIQRAVGYSLTGCTDEEVLFLLHGKANTGKSTFVGAVKAALGGLARTADFATFLEQKHVQRGGPSEDIARLAGARIVASIEVEDGARLAHSLVKTITGKEVIAARFLNKGTFEFMPAFKLWLVCNAAPRVDHDDDAMWRRVLRIPLDRVVPKADRNPKLKAHLVRQDGGPAEGSAAVLAWAVQGCLEWQRIGLAVPEAVRIATEGYREENDALRAFLLERCVIDLSDLDGCWVLKSTFRAEYEDWAKGVGAKFTLSPKGITANLLGRGIAERSQRTDVGPRDSWRGIRLRTSQDPFPT